MIGSVSGIVLWLSSPILFDIVDIPTLETIGDGWVRCYLVSHCLLTLAEFMLFRYGLPRAYLLCLK